MNRECFVQMTHVNVLVYIIVFVVSVWIDKIFPETYGNKRTKKKRIVFAKKKKLEPN